MHMQGLFATVLQNTSKESGSEQFSDKGFAKEWIKEPAALLEFINCFTTLPSAVSFVSCFRWKIRGFCRFQL